MEGDFWGEKSRGRELAVGSPVLLYVSAHPWLPQRQSKPCGASLHASVLSAHSALLYQGHPFLFAVSRTRAGSEPLRPRLAAILRGREALDSPCSLVFGLFSCLLRAGRQGVKPGPRSWPPPPLCHWARRGEMETRLNFWPRSGGGGTPSSGPEPSEGFPPPLLCPSFPSAAGPGRGQPPGEGQRERARRLRAHGAGEGRARGALRGRWGAGAGAGAATPAPRKLVGERRVVRLAVSTIKNKQKKQPQTPNWCYHS